MIRVKRARSWRTSSLAACRMIRSRALTRSRTCGLRRRRLEEISDTGSMARTRRTRRGPGTPRRPRRTGGSTRTRPGGPIILAGRQARLELLAEYLDERGPIRDRRSGDVRAAAVLEESLRRGVDKQVAVLLDREQRYAEQASALSLESIVAELTEDETLDAAEDGAA